MIDIEPCYIAQWVPTRCITHVCNRTANIKRRWCVFKYVSRVNIWLALPKYKKKVPQLFYSFVLMYSALSHKILVQYFILMLQRSFTFVWSCRLTSPKASVPWVCMYAWAIRLFPSFQQYIMTSCLTWLKLLIVDWCLPCFWNFTWFITSKMYIYTTTYAHV